MESRNENIGSIIAHIRIGRPLDVEQREYSMIKCSGYVAEATDQGFFLITPPRVN